MNKKIPAELEREPLLEAIWEIRFSNTRASAADLLPGMLFKAFADKFDKVTRLPAADYPAQLFKQDPNLRYVPKIRLENDNMAIQTGDCVVSLNCRRPYPGWNKFSGSIRE